MTFKAVLTGQARVCEGCGRENPVVSYRNVGQDLEIAACVNCDGLRVKDTVKRRGAI